MLKWKILQQWLFVVAIMVLLTSCSKPIQTVSGTGTSPATTPTKKNLFPPWTEEAIAQPIPTSSMDCPAAVASWHNLIPGRSTMDDVLRELGEPFRTEMSPWWNQEYFVYPPMPISSTLGVIGNFIYFREDNIVEWMDVWVSVSGDDLHTVAEYVESYGATLDRVEKQGTGDFYGPAQIYIWSSCGIALTTIPIHAVGDQYRGGIESTDTGMEINLRYPIPLEHSLQPTPDIQDIVVRAFIFPPTQFENFDDVFKKRMVNLGSHFLALEWVSVK